LHTLWFGCWAVGLGFGWRNLRAHHVFDAGKVVDIVVDENEYCCMNLGFDLVILLVELGL
jgi:hypothetical protein